MAATAEAAEMAAEGAAIVEAEAVKNHIGGEGNVRTNFGAGSLVTTSARPALAVRGAPRERLEDEYWVADSSATENVTQDSSNLEDYTPVSLETR